MKFIVAVTNDLLTDQRVDRTCNFLHDKGHEVLLYGRKRKNSPPMNKRPYQFKRVRLLFERGALFYAAFNIRLFFYLLFSRFDVIVSNDLDSLPACYLICILKRKKIIYDTHEYFTGVPELENRKFVKRTWEIIEKMIFPGLKNISTVNHSIAKLYADKYGKELVVVRNIPQHKDTGKKKSRRDLGLPEDKFIIILQGAGINIHRGAEEAVEAMKKTEGALLLIAGSGDVVESLKKFCLENGLTEKVRFFPRMPYDELIQYTMNSDLGLTLDKSNNINYRFSLPNKLFDYIHAGIPVLASPLVEVSSIINKYNCGIVLEEHSPENIQRAIEKLMNDTALQERLKNQTRIASSELTWEKEKTQLELLYKNVFNS